MKEIVGFVAAVMIPLSAPAQNSRPPDLGALGPYAIGHTSFAVVDTNTAVSGKRGIRPIGVNVWYPLDASDVVDKAPDGLYPFDPIYAARHPTPPTANPIPISSDFENPCDNLPAPDPIHPDLCESKATHFPPASEGLIPSARGPFPLVLFSPGWGNPSNAYSLFAERLASHGFVVAVLQHYHDGYPSWDVPKDSFAVAMYNRPRDMSLILDTLLARNREPGDLLHNSINQDLVAAAGHSIGGYAALAIAGGDDATCEEETDTVARPNPCTPITDGNGNTLPTTRDLRIKAIVTLDAGNQHLYFSELARITVPSLTIGEWFGGPGWDTYFPARQHAAMSGDPKYRVDVVGALHQSFANNCTGIWVRYRIGLTSGPDVVTAMTQRPYCATPTVDGVQILGQAEVIRLATQYALAFLKTYLVGEAGYQKVLTPGWTLNHEENVEFFVTEPTSDDPTTFLYFPYQRSHERVNAKDCEDLGTELCGTAVQTAIKDPQ